MPRLTAGGLAVMVLLASGAARAEATGLSAGASTVDLNIPAGTSLAGYGSRARRTWVPWGRGPAFWFRPATGLRDPLRVRALVLQAGAARLLWLAVDLVGVDPRLVGDLETRLAGPAGAPPAVIVSASHTHSGPGGFADSELFGVLTLDRPSPEVRHRLLEAMAEAAARAEAQRQPALVGARSVRVRGVNGSRIGAVVDEELVVLKVITPAGRPLALLWNFAVHGTTLGKRNLALSADIMGEASARLEAALGVPALFVNGAVGDASPRARGEAGLRTLGAALSDAALRAWHAIAAGPERELRIVRRRVQLPAPRLSLRDCLGRWVPPGLALGLGAALPTESELLGVALGSRVAAVTVPGELQMALGLALKAGARADVDAVILAGVSNDYLGYFLAPGEPGRRGYMACASLYGDGAAEELGREAADLLRAVGQGARREVRPVGARPSPPASSPAPTSSAPPCCGE